LNDEFDSGCCSDSETSEAIKKYFDNMGEVLCPHSAIGVNVAESQISQIPMITLATAHPAKFPDAVANACGITPDLPSHMADLYERNERMTRVSGDLKALEAIIRKGIK
jgi:threonine synthase